MLSALGLPVLVADGAARNDVAQFYIATIVTGPSAGAALKPQAVIYFLRRA